MARNFDEPSGDYIDHGNPAVLGLSGDEVTLSLWVRIGTANGEYKIFAKWSDNGAQFSYLLSLTAANRGQLS